MPFYICEIFPVSKDVVSWYSGILSSSMLQYFQMSPNIFKSSGFDNGSIEKEDQSLEGVC
jgi:hypothetical protein